ncbi:oxygen-independent coproporphyrinogen III oxidase, Fe-S oxidoreductase [Plesiocystis pacifica SIR-1]|uniref:Oxygen-independent coproporphyrinogen III oxidase, Fe-S oxidoreductase n=1 Tax=Plesiocystis pacifica SIR-1 TaxID=391625 RepID=A6GFU8_9BACT|nr:radical SAM protein [Plesiocystis pacifica]EDM75246.1 oxygen-independent coproporphyrinogen III oxidase, Fe-S oxidoreductase [Plesiocystis pacifica SIR-1]
MDYVGRIYRPPSEAHSLLIQVTLGCSHNRCVYCDMYRDKRFRPKDWGQVEADIIEAGAMGRRPGRRGFRSTKVFLCDGDALILPTRRLLQILAAIREHLPWVERVGSYGDTRSVGRKSVEELTALREAGLGIVYHGMETGDAEVLERIDKGGTRPELIETADKLRAAGVQHSVIVLLGIGGVGLSEQHARSTAQALTRMDPPYVGALTTTVVPGTPLFDMQSAGEFELPSKFRMLEELRTIVAESEFSNCRFSSNHASNYLPLRGTLPRDKAAMVEVLDAVIARGDEALLKPEHLRGL